MTITPPESTCRAPGIVDTEWLAGYGAWIVSARRDEQWTLVGLFDDSRNALRAAAQASLHLAAPARASHTSRGFGEHQAPPEP